MVLGEVRRRGAHHPRWRLHLGTQRRGAVGHVRGDEGLKGLLGQRAAMLLEGRRSSRARRVVLLGLQLLLMELMRRRHSGGRLHAHVSHQGEPLVVHSSSVSPKISHSERREASSSSSAASPSSPSSASTPVAVLFL